MTTTLEARRLVRNPFEGRDAQADEVRHVVASVDPLVEDVTRTFERLSKEARQRPRNGYEVQKYFDETVQTLALPVMRPFQIGALLQVITPLTPADHRLKLPRRPTFAGMFISRTMADAYKAGARHITLAIPDGAAIDYLAQRLEIDARTDDDRLRVDIIGDVRNGFAMWSKNCDFYIRGDVKGHDYGNHCVACLFDLEGDIHTEWLASGYGNMRIYRGTLRSLPLLGPAVHWSTDTVAVADPKLYEKLIIMYKHEQYRRRERCDVRIELLKP